VPSLWAAGVNNRCEHQVWTAYTSTTWLTLSVPSLWTTGVNNRCEHQVWTPGVNGLHIYKMIYAIGAQPTYWIRVHIFLWRSHTNMNNGFRLVISVYDRNPTCTYSRLVYSQTVYNTKGRRGHTHRELIRKWHNRLNMNRIPHALLRSAYSTCRVFSLWTIGVSNTCEQQVSRRRASCSG